MIGYFAEHSKYVQNYVHATGGNYILIPIDVDTIK